MAEYTKFRLSPADLYPLDALAAGIRNPYSPESAGNRTEAVRDAVAYWHRLVADAASLNADELPPEDWHRLAHLNDPAATVGLDDDPRVLDWSARFAAELVGQWEDRAIMLPEHREAEKADRRLAKRIAGWGIVRGYALMAACRWFWCHPDTANAWWHPEVWLTPETRGT